MSTPKTASTDEDGDGDEEYFTIIRNGFFDFRKLTIEMASLVSQDPHREPE